MPAPASPAALPSSRTRLLDTGAINWQAHVPTMFPTFKEHPDDAEATEELAMMVLAAAPTAAQLSESKAASKSRRDTHSRQVRPRGRVRVRAVVVCGVGDRTVGGSVRCAGIRRGEYRIRCSRQERLRRVIKKFNLNRDSPGVSPHRLGRPLRLPPPPQTRAKLSLAARCLPHRQSTPGSAS